MKLNRRILRKMILQELTLRGGKWSAGDSPEKTLKLRSPLNLPPLDIDDDTEMIDRSDDTTDLDFGRPADMYLDDTAEPTDPEGWDDFWNEMQNAPTEKIEPPWQPTPTPRQDLRSRKQEYLMQPDEEQDTEVETEAWEDDPEAGLRSVKTGEGEYLASHVRGDVKSKAHQLSPEELREHIRRMIIRQLLAGK